jgi:hypothetical protein
MFSAFSAPVFRALAGHPYLGAQPYNTAINAKVIRTSGKVFISGDVGSELEYTTIT